MSDKLITILNEYPEGIEIKQFCSEYFQLFRENFIRQTDKIKDKEITQNEQFDEGTLLSLQEFFNEYSEIAVSKYVPSKKQLVLFANVNQKISLNISNWIENIIVKNPECWFNALLSDPNHLFVEYSIKSPSTLILNGRLSYLEGVIQYLQWLDQIEQYTLSSKLSESEDAWTIFVSQSNLSNEKQSLFDMDNYHHNNGRYKISKELLLYGIKQSYFMDISNAKGVNSDTMRFNESIFVHHPFDAPSPILLSKFLELQIETDGMDEIRQWKVPLVVQNILKRKQRTTIAPQQIFVNHERMQPDRSRTRNVKPMKEESRREIQAKIVEKQPPLETSSKLITKATSSNKHVNEDKVVKMDDISLPIAIENNLEKLSKHSDRKNHKITADIARNLLHVLRQCEMDNYAKSVKLDSISVGSRHKIAISEYDIVILWKSYYRTGLNVNHSKMMQELIYIYYPYFEIHLVPSYTNSTKYMRYISIREDSNVLSADNNSPSTFPDSDKTPIYNAGSFQRAVSDLITSNKQHSDGLHLSQIITKLSQSNAYIFKPAFFEQNWDKRHSLWLLHDKHCGLSIISSSPRYDPIVAVVESEHNIQDFIMREVHGHDRRDGNGVPLPAILSLVRAVSPTFVNSQFASLSETANTQQRNRNHDDVINFLQNIQTIDLMSVNGKFRNVTNLNDVTIYASPNISELHDSITDIIKNESTSQLISLDHVSSALTHKYPALKLDKYGFENDIEALIESTPNYSVHKLYPLSPSYGLPTPYVTLCDAISRCLPSLDANRPILEVQLRSAVTSALNPKSSNSNIENEVDSNWMDMEKLITVKNEIFEEYEE